jgi:hypothetical protein
MENKRETPIENIRDQEVTVPTRFLIHQPVFPELNQSLSPYEKFAHTVIRFKYSRISIALYFFTTLLSIASVLWSIIESCPSGLFILFELIINFLLIFDVLITLIALKKV